MVSYSSASCLPLPYFASFSICSTPISIFVSIATSYPSIVYSLQIDSLLGGNNIKITQMPSVTPVVDVAASQEMVLYNKPAAPPVQPGAMVLAQPKSITLAKPPEPIDPSLPTLPQGNAAPGSIL